MAGKKSKDKGSRNERAAAKEFRDWWGSDFVRTPGSGSFATRNNGHEDVAGDLITYDKSFPFCVEIKAHEGWAMEQLLRNDGCDIYKWWQQATDECPNDRLPLLVFKKNHHPFYCMIDGASLPNEFFSLGLRYFVLPVSKELTGTRASVVYIMLLSDFFKIDPTIWQRTSPLIVKDRQKLLEYTTPLDGP